MSVAGETNNTRLHLTACRTEQLDALPQRRAAPILYVVCCMLYALHAEYEHVPGVAEQARTALGCAVLRAARRDGVLPLDSRSHWYPAFIQVRQEEPHRGLRQPVGRPTSRLLAMLCKLGCLGNCP